MKRANRTLPAIAWCVSWIVALGSCAQEDEAHEEREHLPCVSCHMEDYREGHRRNPQPTECHVCHAQEAWRPIVHRHGWPLTGAHANVSCAQCHGGTPPAYAGTSTACVSCHRADYELRTFPAHLRYPTTCSDCHSTAAWTPATFDPDAEPSVVPEHDAGAPRTRASGTRSRHIAASPGTRAPSSQTNPPAPAPTPTTIVTPAPEPTATHPESRFPIATGHHAGIACTTCHDQGGTMGRGNTDCVQCHPRGRYDDIHSFVNGYPQGSAAPNFCVNCHRRGTRSRN